MGRDTSFYSLDGDGDLSSRQLGGMDSGDPYLTPLGESRLGARADKQERRSQLAADIAADRATKRMDMSARKGATLAASTSDSTIFGIPSTYVYIGAAVLGGAFLLSRRGK